MKNAAQTINQKNFINKLSQVERANMPIPLKDIAMGKLILIPECALTLKCNDTWVWSLLTYRIMSCDLFLNNIKIHLIVKHRMTLQKDAKKYTSIIHLIKFHEILCIKFPIDLRLKSSFHFVKSIPVNIFEPRMNLIVQL